MKVLNIAIVIVVLLSIVMLAGCQEGYASRSGSTITKNVAYEPTGTGFWKPKTTD
jgi:ABC-type cobalt transport system substrate-binding protein